MEKYMKSSIGNMKHADMIVKCKTKLPMKVIFPLTNRNFGELQGNLSIKKLMKDSKQT